jgi:hypothetical protein
VIGVVKTECVCFIEIVSGLKRKVSELRDGCTHPKHVILFIDSFISWAACLLSRF